MRKRAGLACHGAGSGCAFFDEPRPVGSISARLLDELIIELRDSLGATIVVVTHELASMFAIGNNSVFLDPETKTQIAVGNPVTLLNESVDPRVVRFLTRGTVSHKSPSPREGEV